MEYPVALADRGRFAGRAVIVTGAGSGIGRETAQRFAAEGGLVTVADINADAAAATVAAIAAEGGTARASVTDVADPAAVQAMVDGTVEAYGRLDVLHNNAYWAPLNTTVTDTSDEQWERTIAVTLTGVFLGCKFAIPHMLARGGGAIVNTASTAALVASPKFAAYMAAKAGVLGLTRSVAFDYGKQGIRCNAVCPGLIQTAATVDVFADPERVEWLTSKIVVGRTGVPGDIAAAVLFLASDEASFTTGQALVVDGGRLIG
jgi:NAD(P)-dependent dehydrogenase (short-subunit alcohol dehydrogenase family)